MNQPDPHIEFSQETYRSMIQIATMMIKFCGTVNGGAVLALLTFIGNAYKHDVQLDMTTPFILYAVGIACAGFATMTTYFVQKAMYDKGESVWLYWLTIILVAASIVCFLWASIKAAMVIAI